MPHFDLYLFTSSCWRVFALPYAKYLFTKAKAKLKPKGRLMLSCLFAV